MRFTIQDVRAEVLPDNSASLGGPDPERQASYGTAWTWVGVRAAANILIELDDGRVGFMDIQTPGQYAIPSDDTAQLEKAKAEELALARNIIEELQVNERERWIQLCEDVAAGLPWKKQIILQLRQEMRTASRRTGGWLTYMQWRYAEKVLALIPI